jgi:hypothetical protein
MYSLEDILEMIRNNPEEKYLTLYETIEIPFMQIVTGCHSFDDLIDILNDAICESWLPVFDANYDSFGLCGSTDFFYGDLEFKVSITIDTEEFLREYEFDREE